MNSPVVWGRPGPPVTDCVTAAQPCCPTKPAQEEREKQKSVLHVHVVLLFITD